MPSTRPRTPEVRTAPDGESGFHVNVYDGEYLIQIRPHENGYQLSLASKGGLGDRAFLRTYERNDQYRHLVEQITGGTETDLIFDTIEEHFEDDNYHIVNAKPSIKGFGTQGVDIYVETGQRVPNPVGDREYRNDRWRTEDEYRVRVWPNVEWIEIQDRDTGKLIDEYWPKSYLADIREEVKDDHERERGPTCVPGVYAPIAGGDTVDNGPVIHTRIHCSHLEQLNQAVFNPAGEDPPSVPAGEFGELPLRWCLWCKWGEPTPDEIRDKYGP